jgi:hypothetical protein
VKKHSEHPLVDDDNDDNDNNDNVSDNDNVQPPVNLHPVMRYSVFRLALFAVAVGLLWLVQVRGLLLVALAVLISGLASYALLQRERDAMSARVAEVSARRKARATERAAREDDIADELAAEAVGQKDEPADEHAETR